MKKYDNARELRDDRKGHYRSLEKKEDPETDISNRSGRYDPPSRQKLEPESLRKRDDKTDRKEKRYDDYDKDKDRRHHNEDKYYKSDSKKHVYEEYRDKKGV